MVLLPSPLLLLWTQSPSPPHLDYSRGPNRSPCFDLPWYPYPCLSLFLTQQPEISLWKASQNLSLCSQFPVASHLTQSEIYSVYYDHRPFLLRYAPFSLPSALPLPGLTGLHHIALLACITTPPTSTAGPLHQLFSVLVPQAALSPCPLFLQVLLKCLYLQGLHVKSSRAPPPFAP